MSERFAFSLVSPARQIVAGEALRVHISGAEGDFEVFPHHAPVMAVLRAGVVTLTLAADDKMDGVGTEEKYYIRGGFADIAADNVTILAEHAHHLADMVGATLAAERDAARAIRDAAASDQEIAASDTLLTLLDSL